MRPLRLVLMGTPAFAVPAFEAIAKAGHDIAAVYSQPPRPAGRGQKMQQSPVHQWAEAQGYAVHTPTRLREAALQAIFAGHEADVAVVAAYGLILPQAVLSAPRYGCLNIHASLLPRWRGASPIQHAIWKGDSETGVTIMQMEAGLDTGPMLLSDRLPIGPDTTTEQLHDALSDMGSHLIVEALARLPDGLQAVPQDNAASIYAPLLRREDGVIDWREPADSISRQIRALNPWPGTSTFLAGKRLKVKKAVVMDASVTAEAGTLLNIEGDVACGGGTVLRCLDVQPDSARAMGVADAVRGGYLRVGERFV